MRASEFLTENIKIKQEVKASHHQQHDMRLTAYTDQGVAGYLDYSEWRGEIKIHMIQVHQKRQGVGTALVKHLQSLYPVTEIDWGTTSELGTQLYNSLEFEHVPNNAVIRMTKKLDELKKQEQNYQELAAQWEKSSKTERDRQQFLNATEGWNELHDEISQLEQELHGQKPYRKLIKI